MGRLTLNVLPSFSQFERKVTGERIRDKIAASKKKGMFVGGGIALGYDLKDHKLIVNDAEADIVRVIYRLYLELRCVRRLSAELISLGIVSKRRTSSSGNVTGGGPLARSALYAILKSRTYLGQIQHKGNIYEGEHKAIVDKALWAEVQEVLSINARSRSDGDRFVDPSPLSGFIFDDRGNRLTPSHSSRSAVRRRYYKCQALVQNQLEKVGEIRNVPAVEIEGVVAEKIRDTLRDGWSLVRELLGSDASPNEKRRIIDAASLLASDIDSDDRRAFDLARKLVKKVVVGPAEVEIAFDSPAVLHELGAAVTSEDAASENDFTIKVPIRLTRSGRNKRMIIADDKGDHRIANDSMVMAIARAMQWDEEVRGGASSRQIAKRAGLSQGYVSRVLPLAFLAPDIVHAIYEGRQPPDLKVKALPANLPIEWAEQRRILGFPAR